VGYAHAPPKIPLALPIDIDAFELVATRVVGIQIGSRIELIPLNLRHPVHQQFLIAARESLVRGKRVTG
jgi:hypothetical protein